MKSYKQFVTESNQSKAISENFWRTAYNIMRGGSKAGPAASTLNALGLAHAGIRGTESVMNRDKFGLYNAGAMAVPMSNPYSTTFKLGAIGVDWLRQQKKAEEDRKKLDNKVTGK
tara:strand:+ start:454 stop:798 length:345 start_codon:yes stop_codon:yes gene_type:complete